MEVKQLKLGQTYLDIFHKLSYGTLACSTDYAKCLGGNICEEEESKEIHCTNKIGRYMLEDPLEDGSGVFFCGTEYKDRRYYTLDTDRRIGIRPVLNLKDIPGGYQLIKDKTLGSRFTALNKDVLIATYGYYPQWAENREKEEELKWALLKRKVTFHKKGFTYDYIPCYDHFNMFFPKKREVLSKEEEFYVPLRLSSYFRDKEILLSNGQYYTEGDLIFIKVEAIKWLIDMQNYLAISKDILIGGVRKLDADTFLNRYFAKEIVSMEKEKEKQKLRK